MPPKSDPRKSIDSFPCVICQLNVTHKDKMAVQCEYCDGWSHSHCAKITPEIFSMVSDNDRKGCGGFPYFCPRCEIAFKELKAIGKRVAMMESKLADTLDSIGGLIDEKINICLKNKFNCRDKPLERVGNEAISIPTLDANIQSLIQDALEIESKKNNAVLFGLI